MANANSDWIVKVRLFLANFNNYCQISLLVCETKTFNDSCVLFSFIMHSKIRSFSIW